MTSRSLPRGAPGSGMSPRSWPRPASRRIWPSRPIPPSPAAASGTPRPTRPTAGACGCCWLRAGCRSAGSRPVTSWNAGRRWRPTMICAASTPPGCSASTRSCSTRAPRPWARARCAPSRAWPRCGRPRRAMPGTVGGRPGLRRLLVSYFLAASLRCQASSVAGVTGKTSAQRPADVSAQYRVLVPEHQQFSILRQVAGEHQDGQAEYPAREQVDDLKQHPASQPSPRQACWR